MAVVGDAKLTQPVPGLDHTAIVFDHAIRIDTEPGVRVDLLAGTAVRSHA